MKRVVEALTSRPMDAGEMGGLFFRGDCRYGERLAAYGDRLDPLTLDGKAVSRDLAPGDKSRSGVADETASADLAPRSFMINAWTDYFALLPQPVDSTFAKPMRATRFSAIGRAHS